MKRILVIEDDTSQRQLFKTALEDAGYAVLEAPNGQIGLQLFYQQPCDLVITDIFMPEKDGLETILVLKAQFLNVKIIAISDRGFGDRYGKPLEVDTFLKAAKDFGADCTLKKPFKIQHLLAIVKGLLNSNTRNL